MIGHVSYVLFSTRVAQKKVLRVSKWIKICVSTLFSHYTIWRLTWKRTWPCKDHITHTSCWNLALLWCPQDKLPQNSSPEETLVIRHTKHWQNNGTETIVPKDIIKHQLLQLGNWKYLLSDAVQYFIHFHTRRVPVVAKSYNNHTVLFG